jgi:hypothetical protein
MQVAIKSPNMEMSSELRRPMISPVIKSNSRGARFLDLVRSNKLDVSPQLSKRLSITKKQQNVMELMGKPEKKEDPANRDYLKFSATIQFDPNSSPSQGILSKRKPETPESPAFNSAKVSFIS